MSSFKELFERIKKERIAQIGTRNYWREYYQELFAELPLTIWDNGDWHMIAEYFTHE